ncbi:hypothetical protein [Kitasatospora cineracea]|uniref:Uncharacterized protein n=1 Tax=Kitasatospora cineracea TaxID=88074 RepID=A0A8G1U9I2_9ACTN|nr:hypothetical protein [Kitasatospora cineracea]ROR35346.1 hypothetical protein EDD39_7004 [Kitasatospora cineracea]
MPLKDDLATRAREIQRESANTVPYRTARSMAAREKGALAVETLPVPERTALRCAYTGERESTVQIRPDTQRLGLDDCSDGQRTFRALLALALFNDNDYTGPTARWNYAIAAAYSPVMSPRRDELLMVNSTPENLAGRLLPTCGASGWGVPGLRYEAGCRCGGRASLRLRHLPTGALLTVTAQPDRGPCAAGRRCLSASDMLTVGHCLTAEEHRTLEAVPPISPDARTLLAALTVRYTMVDRLRQWATSLAWDPLDRPEVRDRKYPEMTRGPVRHLWGTGDAWTLRWRGYPQARDVVRALTHREAGVRGAVPVGRGDAHRVVLGTAALDLRDGEGN